VVTDIASAMDLFVTSARLAGAEPPSDRVIDGVDLRARLTGTGASPRQLNFYYWTTSFERFARATTRRTSSRAARTVKENRAASTILRSCSNLATDPGERRDVAAAHPDIVADLLREADAHRRTVVAGRPLFDELLPTPGAPGRGGSPP
jgi:arylsulfatase A-like enzyme